MSNAKTVIIGAGHVGSHAAYALMLQGICTDIVLLDTDQEKAVSQAMDITDGAVFAPYPVRIRAGTYEECDDADIVVLAAGAPRKPGSTRLDVMWDSLRIVQDVAPKLKATAFSGILITISNPADIIAAEMQRLTGYPPCRVLSTGTGLDSARLRRVLSECLGIAGSSIHCCSMGEHGDSQMIPFSQIRIGFQRISELEKSDPQRYLIDREAVLARTRKIGMDIIEGKSATEFGIGLVLADTAKAILKDEHRILPVSVFLTGEYGEENLYAGVPAVLGAKGVEEIPVLPLTSEEQRAFSASCEVIRRNLVLARGVI